MADNKGITVDNYVFTPSDKKLYKIQLIKWISKQRNEKKINYSEMCNKLNKAGLFTLSGKLFNNQRLRQFYITNNKGGEISKMVEQKIKNKKIKTEEPEKNAPKERRKKITMTQITKIIEDFQRGSVSTNKQLIKKFDVSPASITKIKSIMNNTQWVPKEKTSPTPKGFASPKNMEQRIKRAQFEKGFIAME